mmetsp:Transcript_17114/g.39504  ORF Transcript_17114/g.39504 Transcript_17114/m.39504 type:complete len:408 (-) Transcript_17114:227-1450(-)
MNTTEAVSGGASGRDIPLPPYGYKTLCIFNLLLSSIASILCAILLFAMTVPLLFPKRRKYYSTYNLYLAFVALPELLAHALHVYLVLAHQQWNPRPFSDSNDDYVNGTTGSSSTTTTESTNLVWMFDYQIDHVVYIFAAASNLYINVFLTYELYLLLKDSNARKKHRSPRILRVTQQAMSSYVLAMFFVVVHSFILRTMGEDNCYLISAWMSLICVVVIPLTVIVWISYQRFRQELLVSTKSMYEGRLKILVVYFARIVLSDLLIWIPAASIYFRSFVTETYDTTKILTYNISLLLTAIQVFVTFGCTLTKPDARKLITDMVCKWVYCRRDSCESHDCEWSRRWNVMRLSSDDDPYLMRASPGQAPMESELSPKLEAVAVEGTQFSSDSENIKGSEDLQRRDIDSVA